MTRKQENPSATLTIQGEMLVVGVRVDYDSEWGLKVEATLHGLRRDRGLSIHGLKLIAHDPADYITLSKALQESQLIKFTMEIKP